LKAAKVLWRKEKLHRKTDDDSFSTLLIIKFMIKLLNPLHTHFASLLFPAHKKCPLNLVKETV